MGLSGDECLIAPFLGVFEDDSLHMRKGFISLRKLIIHLSYSGKDGQGEEVIKPYTPITLDSDVGYFELVIKVRILGFSVCEEYFNGMYAC